MHEQSKRLTILTPKEIQALYGLPQFTDDEQAVYFALDPLEKQQLDQLRNITAAVYFILQLGYFKAKKQFFVFGFYDVGDDVVYILRRYFPAVTKLPSMTVSKPTRLAQQTEILRLNFLGCYDNLTDKQVLRGLVPYLLACMYVEIGTIPLSL